MLPAFLDTSALAKLYHSELGTESIERLFERAPFALISRLGVVEMDSVLSGRFEPAPWMKRAPVWLAADSGRMFAADGSGVLRFGIGTTSGPRGSSKNTATISVCGLWIPYNLPSLQISWKLGKSTYSLLQTKCACGLANWRICEFRIPRCRSSHTGCQEGLVRRNQGVHGAGTPRPRFQNRLQ